MGVLIILLSAVLIGELARRAFFAGSGGAASVDPAPAGLEPGERVAQMIGGGDRALLLIAGADGSQRLVVLDLADGTAVDWPLRR